MSKKLEGKVAIVTGASKGIGASIAKNLAQEGASVIVNYASSKEDADEVVKEIESHKGKALAVKADVSNPADIKKLFSETKKAFGKVDILVNNAGIYSFAPLNEITPEAFHKMFNLNVLGLLLACKEAAAQFGTSGGNIINISSIASTSRMATGTIYCATKAAVDSITRTLATELGPKKIRINSINPGLVSTEGARSAGYTDGDFAKKAVEDTPLGRIGKPQDIGSAAVFFASDDSSWITGETLYISGGNHGG